MWMIFEFIYFLFNYYFCYDLCYHKYVCSKVTNNRDRENAENKKKVTQKKGSSHCNVKGG